MKILVTGAGGYIGRHVVTELLDRKCDVVAVDMRNDGIDERAEFIQMSVFDDSDKINTLGDFDACIHMAWRNGFVHNDDSHIVDLYNHYKFLDGVINCGIKQILVMGTMHEIGYYEGAIDENTPTNPTSKYGIAKNALRQLMFERVRNTDVILQWCRCYYITGDDLKSNSIFAKLLSADKEGKETFPFTSGKNKYDFIDVCELAKQLSSVVMQKKVCGIINCCSGTPISLGERVEKFIADNNLKIKLDYGKFPDRPYDSPGVWGDNKKIQMIMN